jgi:hypothetical protein
MAMVTSTRKRRATTARPSADMKAIRKLRRKTWNKAASRRLTHLTEGTDHTKKGYDEESNTGQCQTAGKEPSPEGQNYCGKEIDCCLEQED